MKITPAVFTLLLSLTCSQAAENWSIDHPPAVPPPAAPDSKQAADPKDFAEVKMDFPITSGPFKPTWDSIRKNHPGAPEWFREAKFGVFVHWGPQASGKSGDWYARRLYREGDPAYQNHLRNFGHPSEFSYNDVLNAWKEIAKGSTNGHGKAENITPVKARKFRLKLTCKTGSPGVAELQLYRPE